MPNGQKVLVLAADLFEDMELLYPLYRLREEEVDVTVAGLSMDPVTGKKGYGPLEVDTTADQVQAADFDALVIPGGFAPDKLRRSQEVLALVEAFNADSKPIASSAMPAGCRSPPASSRAGGPPASTPSATTW